jgi:hypothetical protein
MTTTIRLGFGAVALFAAIFFLAAGVRSAESQKPAPAAASQGGHEAETGPCQGMISRMGESGATPGGMGGMMAMRGGKGMPGMGMPGMEMGGMEMGGIGMMPMMHEHMMMRMMARNPKLAGKMLQMRADIMRAVADVLTKYGKEMESSQWPAAQGKGDDGD